MLELADCRRGAARFASLNSLTKHSLVRLALLAVTLRGAIRIETESLKLRIVPVVTPRRIVANALVSAEPSAIFHQVNQESRSEHDTQGKNSR